MRANVLSLLTLSAFGLGGCFAEGYSLKDRVTEATRKFNEGVQWNRPEQVVPYLPKEEQHPFVDRLDGLEDELEIAESDMTQLDIDKKHDRATARMTYTWTMKRHGLLEKTTTEQTWVEKHGKLVMIHEIRLRGAPMPLWKERAEVPPDDNFEKEDAEKSKWQGATAGGPQR